MQEAVKTGLTTEMISRSGMVNNGAKKVANTPVNTLSFEFKTLILRTMGAKEVNSCMGRVMVATAGASGILPGILTTLQDLHQLPDRKIHEGLLVAAAIAFSSAQIAYCGGKSGNYRGPVRTSLRRSRPKYGKSLQKNGFRWLSQYFRGPGNRKTSANPGYRNTAGRSNFLISPRLLIEVEL